MVTTFILRLIVLTSQIDNFLFMETPNIKNQTSIRQILLCSLLFMVMGTTMAQIPSIRRPTTNNDSENYISKTKSNNDYKSWFPTIRNDKGEIFNLLYNEDGKRPFFAVNNGSLQVNNDGAIVQTELVSAYLGYTRVSFGTTISNANGEENTDDNEDGEMPVPKTDETQAFQRLITGGGNTYLSFELPLLLQTTNDNLFMIYLSSSGRVNLDVAEFSNDVDASTGNGNISSNLYMSMATDKNEFDFFVDARYGWYFGHDDFYKRLEIADGRAFAFGQLIAGITFEIISGSLLPWLPGAPKRT